MEPKDITAATKRYDWRLLRLLVTPSWISGLLCLLLSIAATIFILVQGRYEGSELQRQFFAWQYGTEGGSILQAVTGQQFTTLGRVISTLQLFIFWYGVGVGLYALISAAYSIFKDIRETRSNLGYMNANKADILRSAMGRLLRQLGALAAWLVLAILTLKVVIPYSFGTIHIANGYLPQIEAVGLLILTPLALAFCLHLHVMLIRLFLGRPRIWHSESYIEDVSQSQP